MEQEKVIFSHFRLTHHNGKNAYVTVAVKLRETKDYILPTFKKECGIVYAFAFCSPKDRFIRKIGRTIAKDKLGNLDSYKVLSNIQFNKGLKYYELCYNLLLMEMKAKSAPNWIKGFEIDEWFGKQ